MWCNRREESDHWCRTVEGDTFKTTFTWSIENYINRHEKKGECLKSSIVIAHGPNNKTFKWQFMLYPRGDKKSDPNTAAIYLSNRSDFDVKAEFHVSVITSYPHMNEMNEMTQYVEVDVYGAKGQDGDWGTDLKVNVDQLKANLGILRDNKDLVLSFNIIVYADEKILSGSKYSKSKGLLDNCKKQVADDYVKMFAEDQFSDVSIECDGQSFKCHQVILSARSPVFMAMFQAEMKEKKTKVVTIKDYSPEVVKEMLCFIYTGSLTDDTISEKLAKDLLRAADLYDLDLLKRVCEEKLCSSLDTGNSVEYLILGDLYHASKLKGLALPFVAMNMPKIVKTKAYKSFHKNHPDLSLEVTLTRFNEYESEEETEDETEVKERGNGN